MDSLRNLWKEAAVLSITTVTLQRSSLDSVFPFSSSPTEGRSTLKPLNTAFNAVENSQLFQFVSSNSNDISKPFSPGPQRSPVTTTTATVSSTSHFLVENFSEDLTTDSTHPPSLRRTAQGRSPRHSTIVEVHQVALNNSSQEGPLSNDTTLVRLSNNLSSHTEHHHLEVNTVPSSPQSTEGPAAVPLVRLVTVHYLCEARRNLEHDLDAVQTMAKFRQSSEVVSVLLQKVREVSDRLFPLLTLDRYSDYFVPTETTSDHLEQAAKEALHLLALVEDLYMLCVNEKPLECERGPVVSLGRLRKLSSVFPEPSEEDRGHIEFLEACLSNPTIKLAALDAHIGLEDALRAVLRITAKTISLPQPLSKSHRQMNHFFLMDAAEQSPGDAMNLIDAAASPSGSSDVLPLFEMLTAPFFMISKVGTEDAVLDTANAAAEILLKSHTNGPLSGFRFFLTPDKVLTGSDPQSLQVAQWFQAVAAGLKAASVATPHAPGSAVEASIDWLRGPGGLHEVSVNRPEDSQDNETLLTVLLQGEAASSIGVPFVVVDTPSSTIFGGCGCLCSEESGNIRSMRLVILLRYALLSLVPEVIIPIPVKYLTTIPSSGASHGSVSESATSVTSLSVTPTPPMMDPHAQDSKPLFEFYPDGVPPPSEGRSAGPESFAVPSFSLEERDDGDQRDNPYRFHLRGHEVDAIRLPCFVKRLNTRAKAHTVVADNAPLDFIVNDNLLFHVVQGLLEYGKGAGVDSITVLLHRCGMHLVIDLIPQQLVPQDTDEYATYCSAVQDFYQQHETRMQASHLFSAAAVVFKETPFLTTSQWIEGVMSCGSKMSCGLPPHLRSFSPATPPASVVTLTSDLLAPSSIASSVSNTASNAAGKTKTYRALARSSMLARAKKTPPTVWALKAAASHAADCCVIDQSQYLAPRICELLSALQAATVVTNTGAATIAFPFITKDRVALLKRLRLIRQPLSAAAHLGIHQLNRMAENAAVASNNDLIAQNNSSINPSRITPLNFGLGSLPLEMVTHKVTIHRLSSDSPLSSPVGQHSTLPLASSVHSGTKSMLVKSNCTSIFALSTRRSQPSSDTGDGNDSESVTEDHGSITRLDALLLPPFQKPEDISFSLSSIHSDTFQPFDKKEYHSMLGDPTMRLSFADFSSLPRSADAPGSFLQRRHAHFPHLRILYLCTEPCQPFIDWLSSLKHSTTVVSQPDMMVGFLNCGIEVFDIVAVEWNPVTASPELQDLLLTAKQNSPFVPVFFFVVGPDVTAVKPPVDADHPPLPASVGSPYVLYGKDMYETSVYNRPLLRSHMRLGRLFKELQGDDSLQFQICNHIGTGGFGEVYEVIMYASKGKLAMKRISLDNISVERMEELYKEAIIMRDLDHRNIVQLSHVTCTKQHLQIFMELCDYTLKEALEKSSQFNDKAKSSQQGTVMLVGEKRTGMRTRENSTSFDMPRSVSFVVPRAPSFATSHGTSNASAKQDLLLLMHDIISAVHYLHNHDIVHRDLKPQNILFLNGVAKLADFGSATTASDRQNALRTMKGTVPYMAPEVFLGEPYRKSCDVWSLGILIGDILGIRFAHTAVLHFPALQAFYKSLEEDESMPVVVTNVTNTGFQKHVSENLLKSVEAALLQAREVAKAERKRTREKAKPLVPLPSFAQPSRTVFAIEVDSRGESCVVSQHLLPACLIELLEGTFCRNPEKRITTEDLLEHPIANEKDWLQTKMDGVTRLNAVIGLTDKFREEIRDDVVDLSFSDE